MPLPRGVGSISHRSHRAPHVRAVFLFPCASPARFSAPNAAHSRAELPPSRSVPPHSRTKFPPPLAHPRRRAEPPLILAPNSHLPAPFLRLRTPSSHLRVRTLRLRAEYSLILAPNSHHPAPFLSPSARPRRARRQSPSSARRASRRRPRLHRTRHKNAPTLPRLGEKT